jgi:CRP-like cAMP-binding protein
MQHPSVDTIKGVRLFADLDDASAAQLAQDFIVREFTPGTEIATAGVGGLNYFIVGEGEAVVSVAGREVARLGPGDSFGEVALVDKDARSATVAATSHVRAYALPIWSFRSFVESRPELLWKLCEMLADRLRAAEARQ